MKGDRFQEAIHFSNIYRNIFLFWVNPQPKQRFNYEIIHIIKKQVKKEIHVYWDMTRV